jgi:hypothetical protein
MRAFRARRSLGQVALIAPLESDGPSHPRRISTINQLNHATVELPGRNMHEHPGAFIRSACVLPGEKEPATANRCRIAIHAVSSLASRRPHTPPNAHLRCHHHPLTPTCAVTATHRPLLPPPSSTEPVRCCLPPSSKEQTAWIAMRPLLAVAGSFSPGNKQADLMNAPGCSCVFRPGISAVA